MNNNFKKEFGPLTDKDEVNIYKALNDVNFKVLKDHICSLTVMPSGSHENVRI